MPGDPAARRRRRAGPAAVVGADHQGVVPPHGPRRRPGGIGGRPSRAPPSGQGPCPSTSTASRSATRSSGWTRAARRTCGASPAAPCKVQGYGVVKLARWLRTTAGIPAQSGKDPIAHILWLKHEEPETYRRAHRVPGTQGLAERPPHRAVGGVIRLDRAALGNRQPPPGPHPLRPGAAAAGRDRAVAAAGTAGRDRHPRPAVTRAGGRARRPGRHPGRGRHARPPVGGDRVRAPPGTTRRTCTSAPRPG